MSIREVQAQRVSVASMQPFDTVVAQIDKQIGHPDMTVSPFAPPVYSLRESRRGYYTG